ncbi:hypothetical protein E5358_12750 [Palleniella muris]|uniref:Uncharacterized protein n=1 Tax=Palleniella muris TaxID=3038145 RepID=A0AC61QMK1_9BACT|nr:hypothetical protein [Palleniella muris]TGX80519.1 hypothetical protein E5358_12750 [Palleniella muris]
MPFVYEEDIDVPIPKVSKKTISFEEEYYRFVESANQPLEIGHVKRPVGRRNYLDKLLNRKRQLTIQFVRFNVIDYDAYNKFQLYSMAKSAQRSKKHPFRCRVGKFTLFDILRTEMIGRIRDYLEEKPVKKKILCIVGESGVGKTLASLHLQNHLGANVICSFTTRPPRETEEEGREHHFVDVVPPPEELLAFSVFGNYRYYATKAQVFGPCTVYVIDEKGLLDLRKRWKDEYEIYSVYITRKKMLRRRRNVPDCRMRRDNYRLTLDLSFYNYVVNNNSTKKCLFESIESIYNEVKDK